MGEGKGVCLMKGLKESRMVRQWCEVLCAVKKMTVP